MISVSQNAFPRPATGFDDRAALPTVRTLLVASQNGGTGRSFLAANFAVLAARAGRRVLLVDLDPAAPLSASLGWRISSSARAESSNSLEAAAAVPAGSEPFVAAYSAGGGGGRVDLWAAAARARPASSPADALREAVAAARDAGRIVYDLAIADGPATAGAELDGLLAVAHDVVLAVRAEPMGLRTLPELLACACRARRGGAKCRGAVLSLPRREAPGGAAEAACRALLEGAPLLGVAPFDPLAAEAALAGRALVDFAPDSPAAAALDAIGRRLGWEPPPPSSPDGAEGREPAAEALPADEQAPSVAASAGAAEDDPTGAAAAEAHERSRRAEFVDAVVLVCMTAAAVLMGALALMAVAEFVFPRGR